MCARSSPPAPLAASGRGPDGRRWGYGSALAFAVWLTAAAAAASMLGGVDAPPGLLPIGVLLSGSAAAVLSPRLAERLLAGVVGVLLLPVLLLVALAVRLSSRGPVLVRQAPAGGSPVARFRTTATGGRAPSASGPGALTRVGRTLHALCLDELPRLLDVARGEAPLHRGAQH